MTSGVEITGAKCVFVSKDILSFEGHIIITEQQRRNRRVWYLYKQPASKMLKTYLQPWDETGRGNMRQRGKPHCSSASVKRVSAKSCLQGSFPPPSPITPSSQRQASFREMHERLEWLLSQPVSDTAELKKLHLHHRADSNTKHCKGCWETLPTAAQWNVLHALTG